VTLLDDTQQDFLDAVAHRHLMAVELRRTTAAMHAAILLDEDVAAAVAEHQKAVIDELRAVMDVERTRAVFHAEFYRAAGCARPVTPIDKETLMSEEYTTGWVGA
jgi:hypothetical protein